MDQQINQAIQILYRGGIVIFPTDTAFGIGCRIDNEEAIKKLFNIRQRPITQAPPVLFESVEQVSQYTQEFPEVVKEQLMDKYWPGALTIVLPANKNMMSDLVRGGGENIGCRIPNSSVCLEIIKGVGVPIIGTSANFNGEPTPYTLEDLDPKLVSLVDLVVPGSTSVHKESTVIDCTQNPWKVLRQGFVELRIMNNEERIKNIVLGIDTSRHDKLIVSLSQNGEKKVFEEDFDYRKSQGVLPLIKKTLKEEGLSFSDLTGIEVNIGPGSFTGLRVGVSIANTLGAILQIPINNKIVGTLVEPVYQ